jgi:hypothetical protein
MKAASSKHSNRSNIIVYDISDRIDCTYYVGRRQALNNVPLVLDATEAAQMGVRAAPLGLVVFLFLFPLPFPFPFFSFSISFFFFSDLGLVRWLCFDKDVVVVDLVHDRVIDTRLTVKPTAGRAKHTGGSVKPTPGRAKPTAGRGKPTAGRAKPTPGRGKSILLLAGTLIAELNMMKTQNRKNNDIMLCIQIMARSHIIFTSISRSPPIVIADISLQSSHLKATD